MKLLVKNKIYRILTISRFLNSVGASIFNLVFVVFASTLPNASLFVGIANATMIVPTVFSIFVGMKADDTENKGKWMVLTGFFQSTLFLLGAFVLRENVLLAFSSLCCINIICDIASDFASGLRMPLIKKKVPEEEIMEAYSFSQFVTYASSILGQAFGVWLLTISTQNFALVAVVNAFFYLLSSLSLLAMKYDLFILFEKNSDSRTTQFSMARFHELYTNLKRIFLMDTHLNSQFLLFSVLIINSLGGALGGLYNISLLTSPFFFLSYSESLLLVNIILVSAMIISSLTPHDYFSKLSLDKLMIWATIGLMILGLANAFSISLVGLLALGFTMYVSGKVSPKISTILMKEIPTEMLAQTGNLISVLFTASIPTGTIFFTTMAIWNRMVAWLLFFMIAAIVFFWIVKNRSRKNE